jgi:hypothetical protein
MTSVLAVLAAIWLPVCRCAVMTLSGQGCQAGGGLVLAQGGQERGGCSEPGCGGGDATGRGGGAVVCGAAGDGGWPRDTGPGPGCERCMSCRGGGVWLVGGAGPERVAEPGLTGWVEVAREVAGWGMAGSDGLKGVRGCGPPGGGGAGAWAVARANRAGLSRWGVLRI